MGAKYVVVDRQTPMLLAEDLRDWVAKDDLVHLVIDLVEGLPWQQAAGKERGTGSAQYPPGMMLALLIYAYAQGVFSSRRIEAMTYQQVGTRYLCANTHPDHDTIAAFRRKNRPLLEGAFVHVLQMAREMKLLNVGTVYLDGTKLLANASKRANLSAEQLQQQVEALDQNVVRELVEKAEVADQPQKDDGPGLPPSLRDPTQRRQQLAAAEAALAARKKKQTRDQTDGNVNLTDPDSRLMPTMQGPFVQGYNAQLAVEEGGLIVGGHVVAATNDRQQLGATLDCIPPQCGPLDQVVADMGYDHHQQITEAETQRKVLVYCRPQPTRSGAKAGRQSHQRQRCTAERQRRQERVDTALGQELLYRRQTTIEPIFGLIKRVLGFTRFQLRGLPKVNLEWNLLTLAFNCWRLWRRTRAGA